MLNGRLLTPLEIMTQYKDIKPFLSGDLHNLDLIEDFYHKYLTDPSSLDSAWQSYFYLIESLPVSERKQKGDLNLEPILDYYRTHGHFTAKVNPIALNEKKSPHLPEFKIENLTSSEKEILDKICALYCGQIGFEFKHIQNPEIEEWIQNYIETGLFNQTLSKDQKIAILEFLERAELFDSFLHTKYVGQKRFSLEGAETLIPMLGLLIEAAAEKGLEEIIMGMTHRGRLNVMTNLLNKPYKDMFSEFEEGHTAEFFEGTGDVKYHKGHQAEAVLTRKGKKMSIHLIPNPSHLESVDPVVEGQTRAKQFLRMDANREKVIPILIHGDAAISGQGVVYETMQFGQLEGYSTGGTIHFVLNNQIGFTTIPRDLRSTNYCTDIAKVFQAPVLHVNVEDPEGCVSAALFAWKIRSRFHCDVFVELNCYRKYGHNETDEPAFTQPLEYQIIRKKKPVHQIYKEELIKQGIITREEAESKEDDFKQRLHQIHADILPPAKKAPEKVQNHYDPFKVISTGVPEKILKMVADGFSTIPERFNLHPKLTHHVKERLKMMKGEKPIDWGMAESLAYATLLVEKVSIRISGQDSCRGTFSHRHAVWIDQMEEREYFPLNNLNEKQGRFEIYNSTLSEFAVLGFEYGYSVANPSGLTIWEAQFGDFSNGAQVIIDQYIASGEQKWGQQSGLVLYLPHGYEGQGPEHSSARLERFLSLAGHDNMQIVNPTTPAQLFHLLRRQMVRPILKPLIVMTPKGLLRHPLCVNEVKDFTQGHFEEILDDPLKPVQAETVIFCSGRWYYDLMEEREKRKREDIALIRIEQLYPLDKQKLRDIIKIYDRVKIYLWVQEEHQNMGAWTYIQPLLFSLLPRKIPFDYVGRERSATPATGSHRMHKLEHDKILNQVFSHEKRD